MPRIPGRPSQEELELEGELCLRPALPEDRFRIRGWLSAPEAALWWGGRASAEAQITLAMGSAAALCRIIQRDGAPVGYAQAAEMGLWSEARPQELPSGGWQVAILLAPDLANAADLRERALAAVSEEVFSTTLAVACTASLPVTCEALVRAYENVGFHWIRVWNDPLLGAVWLMLKERGAPLRRDR